MNMLKRAEGKKDFFMEIITHLMENKRTPNEIAQLLNIPEEELKLINSAFEKWEEEVKEKNIGAAQLIVELRRNNPQFKLENRKSIFAEMIGITLEDLLYLEEVIRDEQLL